MSAHPARLCFSKVLTLIQKTRIYNEKNVLHYPYQDVVIVSLERYLLALAVKLLRFYIRELINSIFIAKQT